LFFHQPMLKGYFMSRSSRKQRKQKRKEFRMMSNHHCIPKSRGGRETIRIHRDIHHKYHALFNNMTPDEVLEYLIEVFWGGYIPRRCRSEHLHL
jgi:hypothetical protein